MTTNINALFSELAQYNMILKETSEIVEGLKDQIKNIMLLENIDTLTGDEHKATFKEITQNKFNSAAFKAAHADLYQQYTTQSTYKRFDFS